MNYSEQKAWKEIQCTLPEDYRFTEKFTPTEEWWAWRGHKIHLDCFRNPDADVKVIMLHGVGTNGRQMSMITGGAVSEKRVRNDCHRHAYLWIDRSGQKHDGYL